MHRVQLRLPDKNDVDELLGGRLEIGNESDLLEYLGGEVLRLVDDQHDVLPRRLGFQEETVEGVDQILALISLRNDPQIVVDGAKELDGVEGRIENESAHRALVQLLHEIATKRGLSGTHLAGDRAESPALLQPKLQVSEGLAVLGGEGGERGGGGA